MSWFLPRRIYDELVAKASKPKAEQPTTVNVHFHVTALDSKQVEDFLRKHRDVFMRHIAKAITR